MNILVTGSSGFLGKNLVKELLRNGHSVTGIDLKKDNINHKRYKHNILNISQPNSLNKIIKLVSRKNLVIHTAAKQPYKIENNLDEYMKINFYGTKNILDALKKKNIKKFIYCSSFSVYENKKGSYLEDSPLNPNNTYGLSKKLSEDLVRFYSKSFNIKSIILRFDGIFGSDQNLPGFIKMCMSEVIANKNIVLFNEGKLKRDYLYIDDAIQSIILSIKKINKFQFEIFNIGGGQPTALYYIFDKIKKTCKSTSKVIFKKANNKGLKNIFMNINKAKNKIYFKPNKLKNNLEKMYYDFKK